MKVTQSCLTFVTPWTVAHQAPLSMEFSRQGYWSGLPFPSLGDLPHPGIEPRSPALQAILYFLSHQGSLRRVEWVAYPFSRGYNNQKEVYSRKMAESQNNKFCDILASPHWKGHNAFGILQKLHPQRTVTENLSSLGLFYLT